MSDKLDWRERHAVLFLHPTVQEVVDNEMLELSSDLSELAASFPESNEFLEQLVLRKNYKEACRFLCYNMHRRAAIWWAYRCVVDLGHEVALSPFKPRDIADIGKPKPFNIPDWAKMPEDIEKISLPDLKKQVDDTIANFKAEIQKIIDPDVIKLVDEVKAIFDDAQRERYGKTLEDLLNEYIETFKDRDNDSPTYIDMNSPLFQAEAKLREDVEKMRQDTVETIKSVLPDPDVKMITKRQANALDRVYAYVVSPDNDNAQQCLEIGNKIPDQPEGLLAMSAYWSFGNLSSDKNNVVKTPAGLMANGLNGLMMMCALKQGGDLKPKQRFEKYYNLGYGVLIGSDNWGDSVEKMQAPHRDGTLLDAEKEPEKKVELPGNAEQKEQPSKPQPSAPIPSLNRFKGF